MAASYPSLLASGISDLDRFDPFDLFAGESDIVTDQGQAADGQAIKQFEVLMLNAAGRYVPWTISDNYATGTITVGGQPANSETVTINGEAITFVTSGTPTATQVLVGADTTETAQALKAVINGNPSLYGVTAAGDANALTLTAIEAGTAGNSVTLAEAVTDAGFTVSGATLSGADASADVPSNQPVAIAAQPVSAATPGNWLPVFVGGVFNHEALVWPAGIATLAQRKMAFLGTPIGVRQLL